MGSSAGKRTQFAMAFVPWIEEWQRMELSGTQTRVMLMMASRMERSPEGCWSYFSRSEMAERLGVSERTVKNAIDSLKKKGALSLKGYGSRGHCQEYWLMPGIDVVYGDKPEKGTLTSIPNVKGYATEGQKGTPGSIPYDKGYAAEGRKGTLPSIPPYIPEAYSARPLKGRGGEYRESLPFANREADDDFSHLFVDRDELPEEISEPDGFWNASRAVM